MTPSVARGSIKSSDLASGLHATLMEVVLAMRQTGQNLFLRTCVRMRGSSKAAFFISKSEPSMSDATSSNKVSSSSGCGGADGEAASSAPQYVLPRGHRGLNSECFRLLEGASDQLALVFLEPRWCRWGRDYGIFLYDVKTLYKPRKGRMAHTTSIFQLVLLGIF